MNLDTIADQHMRKRRTLDQNAKLHAMLRDIERAGIEWAGRPRAWHEWKTLLVSAHRMATYGGPGEIVEGIEGEPVQLREPTHRMTKTRLTSLVEYVYHFGAEHGVRWSDERYPDYAD